MAESQVLKRLDFPAYCVQVLDNGLVAIAGGGGTSKTGVGNSIELGHVNYTTVELASRSGPNSHAQFQSIHTYEPQDAVMKFISFAVDRNSPQGNNMQRSNAKTNNKKSKGKNSKNVVDYNDQILPEFDANKSDLYIAACVNNSIEIYKVQPMIDKHSTNLTSRRTRTNSNSSSSSGHTPVSRTVSSPTNDSNTRQRHPSSNSLVRTVSALSKDVIFSNNMTASANLILQKSIHIDQIINENDLSEPETKAKVTKKLSQSLNANRFDEETINTVAVCQIKTIPGRHRILLCSGTSKGNICVYELLMRNDSNNSGGGLLASNEIPIKCNKLKVFTEAHGKQDVDDLQINKQQSQLLSIGKDNKCIIWSLTPKIEKLTELNYIAILGDSNLRMRHGRFAQNGNILYTTYVPRIRGGGRSMNTYIHRWDSSTPTYKVLKTHRIRYTQITSIQASKEGDCLVCGDCEGLIFLFDANFNRLAYFKKQHSSVVTDLAFYHDSNLAYNSNKLILSLSIDRTLQCYTYLDTKQAGFGYGPFGFLLSMGYLSSLALQKMNSMTAFKVFMLMSVLVLLFCYFFTFFE